MTQTVKLNARLVLRNDSSPNWSSKNPTLLKGELAYDYTLDKFKIGDGTTAWKDLPYLFNQVIEIDGPPSEDSQDVYDSGTIWINTLATPPEIYVLGYEEDTGKIWQKLLTAQSLEGYGLMKKADYTPAADRLKKSGYVDKALVADSLTTPRTINLSGAVAGSGTFNGTQNLTLNTTLSASGVTAGTYAKVTVSDKGLVTAGGSLTAADIPTLPTSKITGLGSAATRTAGTAAGNVPVLDASGKLPEATIPALALTDTYEAANQTAMLALDAQKGDICIRTDLSKTYILAGTGAATVTANWKELRTPTDAVQSVNGKTGAVTLRSDDIPEGVLNFYYSSPRFDKDLAGKTTDDLREGTNLYYTTARVKAFMEDAETVFVMDGGGA